MEEKTQNRYGNLDGLKVVAAFGIDVSHSFCLAVSD